MTRDDITVLKDKLIYVKTFTRDKDAISIDQGLALIGEIERLESELAKAPSARTRRAKPAI